jgi:hypothetical protein
MTASQKAGLALVLALPAAACAGRPADAPVAASPAIDTTAIKAGIAEMWNRFNRAEENHDLPGLVATVAEKVRVEGEGQAALLDRAQFEAKGKRDFGLRKYNVVDFAPIATTVRDTNSAYQYGTLLETHTPVGGTTETAYGRWAGEMIREGGQWRIKFIIGFLDSIRPLPAKPGP